MTTEVKIKMICPQCGSDDVSRDGTLRWDIAAQKWYVSGEHDTFYCEGCDSEIRDVVPSASVATMEAPTPLPDVLVVIDGLSNLTADTVRCYVNQSDAVGRVMVLGYTPDKSTDPALDAISSIPTLITGSDVEWDAAIAFEQDRGRPRSCTEFIEEFMEKFHESDPQ